MKFSLIVPTRERPKLFFGYLESIVKCTKNIENVEVIVICDEDDDFSIDYVKQYQKIFGMLDIKLLTRERTEFINEDYYNFGARASTGDVMWIMGDDLEIVAGNWDLDVEREYESWSNKYPDKIFMIAIKDNTPSPSHKIVKPVCFPMFTREVLLAQENWLLLPNIPTWGVDTVMQSIYAKDRITKSEEIKRGLDRICYLYNRNYLNHISVHTKQIPVGGEDATAVRVGQIFNRLKMRPEYSTDVALDTHVPQMINILRQKIKDYYTTRNLAIPSEIL